MTRRIALLTLVLFVAAWAPAMSYAQDRPSSQHELPARYETAARSIIDRAVGDTSGFERLGYLVDTFGPRFSGTQALENAIDWILEEMRSDGFLNVRGEDVIVPRWVRGEESLTLLQPRRAALAVLGLGGSIGTPPDGVSGEVLVVRSRAELEARGEQARGKVVLYNVPFTTYGETVQYRTTGAVWAAEAGAVASLVRSVAPVSLNTPHTGNMHYAEDVARIPSAAVTVEAAEMMQRMQDRGQSVRVRLQMEAQELPDVRSRNVVAELVGSERPKEVVVVGGHIDSWDVGQGAVDDAGGCVAAWEAVRLLMDLGLRPRRTIRVVLWTNEENGLRGATAYRDQHADELSNHVLAIESDAGVFTPQGFGFGGTEEALRVVRNIGELLDPIDAGRIVPGGGGADIAPLMQEGVPGMGLEVEGDRYFWYHHSPADMLDKLTRRDFNLSVAAMAVMAYVAADMLEPIPRAAAASTQ